MNLHLNGKERGVDATNVEALVAELGLPLAATLVEHNGTALLRSEWLKTQLQDRDRLEIIRMVAGG
ncbi:MAG: sulfur carrier protein ThiS [Verrucomicrobia bacterium]|jgi:sulfur carrier protein|nr:sulfur carrier protein ThiS [Verrucomicrobiota bacterium]MDA1203513.1 sulfur carrier protein ThiS [Verrucomicrobiota bacterium]